MIIVMNGDIIMIILVQLNNKLIRASTSNAILFLNKKITQYKKLINNNTRIHLCNNVN